MKLHSNPASPFGRKVKVVAIETGLFDRIEVLTEVLSPVAPNAAVMAANPLGKIPCLVTDDGTPVYDSRVICEYLDGLHDGARLFPAAGPARQRALLLQALGDGIMDAAILCRYEGAVRPEALRWPDWIAGQKGKVSRGLDVLERDAPGFGERVDIGTITIGCVLGYLDFRFAADRWRDGRPALAAWFEGIYARPGFQRTIPA